ncbi:MAG: tRNA (adenosine(37)-N6)-threonylcarbamoyltransferase complex transferase subunit TsaD [Candidatus Pacebacteria bacterium]|nr:tRNA (adenosine(37)-N6)-threonylcarbamoyltransferase complex transferase subunit TsaD [Candidatus Paceibacterota bacterium]
MKILAIETSCDETGICILENIGTNVSILGNALSSQVEIHAQYGGVFPALAKRAHAEKMVPLLTQALDEAYLLEVVEEPLATDEKLAFLNEKETQLKENLAPFLSYYKKPDIDYIAVTVGPGLEPALWVGVNTARALSVVWNIPVIPINHMEGHVVTAMLSPVDLPAQTGSSSSSKVYKVEPPQFPLLSLLVSGGHTELVLSESLGSYKKIGQTRDDAVGEAFDKVARMLGLPYPGGPAVSKLASEFRSKNIENVFEMPKPMIHSGDYDFSFSGIKTAMLYTIRDLTISNSRELENNEKEALACAFEDAAIEVLIHKTLKAVEEYQAQTVIVGGGVAGNTYLRNELSKALLARTVLASKALLFPEQWLATDNAVMIGMAAMMQVFSEQIKTRNPEELRADGNLSL